MPRNSIATLAVEWAYQLDPIIQKVYEPRRTRSGRKHILLNCNIRSINSSVATRDFQLKLKFGTWEIEWEQ
jgi:hypothetical protein